MLYNNTLKYFAFISNLLMFFSLTCTTQIYAQCPTLSVNVASVLTPSFCAFGSTSITTSGSETGVSYYMANSASSTISGPVAGTGSALNFATGMLNTTTTYSVIARQASGAINFDGVDDMVSITETPALQQFSVTPMTMEAWVYPTDIIGTRSVIRKEGSYSLYLQNGRIYFEMYRNSGATNYTITLGQTILPANQWSHIAAVWAGGIYADIYLNGNQEIIGGGSSTNNNVSPLTIGRATIANQPFAGKLDEIRIWNTQRTATQIKNNMRNCLTGSETGLLAYYKMEDTGTTIIDAAGGDNNGTLLNTDPATIWNSGIDNCGCTSTLTPFPTVTINPIPTIVVNSPTMCAGNSAVITPSGANTYTITGGSFTVNPVSNTNYSVTGTSAEGCIASNTAVSAVSIVTCSPAAALNFDGSNDFVSANISNLPVNNSHYTIEAKIKPNALGVEGIVGWGNYGTTGQSNALRLDGTGNIINYWWGPDLAVSSSPVNLLDGNWHHVAATFDGTTRKIYLDGVLKGSDTPGSAHAVPNSNFRVGSTNNGEYFNGNIDEVRVWNIGRTQCEINAYKDCEIAGSETGLLANYHFNQGLAAVSNSTVTNLTDASGNSNTGTLNNFALTGSTSNWVAPGGVVSGSVTPVSSISASIAVTNVACNGDSNGVASITASGGAGSYTYLWSNGAGTSAITGLLSGVYTATVTDANSCRSIKTASVSQPPALVTTTAVTNVACNGGSNGVASITASGGAGSYTYLWSNGAGTSAIIGVLSGVYTATVTDANSCTSIKTASVSQPPALVTTTAVTNVACNGGSNGVASITASGGAGSYTYLWSNGAGTSAITGMLSGIYTATVTDANSCRSIKTASISQPAAALTATAIASSILCHGGITTITITANNGTPSYAGVGTFTALAGTHTYTVTDANSCSTTASVSVTEPVAITHSFSVTACDFYNLNATTYTASGIYTQVLTGASSLGCDSTIILNLTIKHSTSSALTQTACDAFTLNGTTYTSGGTYTQMLTNAAGCDSTLTLNLTIKHSTSLTLTQTACDAFTLNGVTYTSGGTYTQMLTNKAGCDSTLTLNLTIKHSTSSTLTQTACDAFTLNGTTYTSGGTYTQMLTNAAGCDSTLTLNLTIKHSTSSTVTQTACDAFTLNGTTYTAGGTYTQMLTNATGCDSTLTLNLTIKHSTSSTLTQTACDAFTLNGTTYTSGGTYTQMLTNAAGCDSTLTLNLTIKHSTSSTLTQTACDAFTLNGTTYTAGGTYTQMLTNAAGCDSTIILNLTIKHSTSSTLTQTACDAFTLNGTTYTSGGTYTQMLTNAAGCDSTLTLNLTISSLPTLTVTTTNTLMCAGQTASLSVTGATSYTWSTTEIASSIEVSPTTTTTYTVEGTDTNGCFNTTTFTQDVDLCTGIATLNAIQMQLISVYPNPSNGVFTIEVLADSKVVITNALGQVVINGQMTAGKHELDINKHADGIYFVKVTQNNNQQTIRLIKK